jgi:hypothetical protein
MPTKSLKIDSLDLDLENPRIRLATDQRDAMQKIISEQKGKLINLAESIAVKGFSPMDRCLVLRSDANPAKFIVLEGNRRVLCAKLLKKPALIMSLNMPEPFKKRLQKAALGFDVANVEPVDCFEVANRAEGNDWIRQRHSGADEGRGIVGWSAMAVSRFRGRDPGLQALEFVLEHGPLTDDQKDLIIGKFPITTLERLLATPAVRTSIGFDIDKGKLLTELPPDEAIKPLTRIILDLADKKINVTGLKSKTQQTDYINQLKSSDKPNLSLKKGPPVAIESITQKDFTSKSPTTAKKGRAARNAARTTVVPKACKLNVTNAKIAEIYGELRTLQLAKHPHAIAVLLRVFLETSVDHYLTTTGLGTTYTTPAGPKDKSLKKKVDETIDDMVTKGLAVKGRDLIGVTRAIADVNHPFSPEILHAYIHNSFYTPVERDLTAAWDNGQPLFERIWP